MPCPNAERICRDEQITLPNHLLLDKNNVAAVIEAVAKLKANVDELRQIAD
jgi:hypothetical protein